MWSPKRWFFYLLLILCAGGLGLAPLTLQAQNFNEGLQYYQQKKYKKAASIFDRLDTPEGYLFSGKSYYALRQYNKAQSSLDHIPPVTPSYIQNEAAYTSALINFQRKDFSESLKKLYEVANNDSDNDLASHADKLYKQILDYLTARQRKTAIKKGVPAETKYDLLKTGFGKINYQKAQNLYQTFTRNVGNDKWKRQAKEFKSFLSDSNTYQKKYGQPAKKLQPPEGTIYTIGIALPKYPPNDQSFDVAKGLYFGALLAADQFNNRHSGVRAYIHFIDTGTSADSIKSITKKFARQAYGDVIIGPLFSDQAKAMIAPADKYHIPVMAPLANADIDNQHSFLFQANPTYKMQGRKMAKYAINNLGINKITIIADKNSNGASAAKAFRSKAQKLNVDISHYFVRNLQSSYEFSKYTRYFTSSFEPVNTVYAPLDGTNALTLMDLMLRKLHTVNHHVIVLGSQEWQNYEFKPSQNKNVAIYFSTGTYVNNQSRLKQFKNKYQEEFNDIGNHYSMIGYDVTRFILKTLKSIGNPGLLPSAIPQQPLYRGLVRNIDFDGGNVNKGVRILKFAPDGSINVRR
jgi:ABC-type branched-subunit amino acid transport system substrate-binding protein